MTKKTTLYESINSKNEDNGKVGPMQLRIKGLREQNQLCQRNLAEYLGCTQQTYSRYETGELEPSVRVLEKLAYFYATSVDYLLGLSDITEARWNDESYARIAEMNMDERKQKALEVPKKKQGRPPKKRD